MQRLVLGNEAKLIRLNNKPRVVVTYFGLHYSGFTKWCRWLLGATEQRNVIMCANTSTSLYKCTNYVLMLIYIADMYTKEVSKCTTTSD